MRDRNIGRAPDYTVAALTMLGVNLLWIFFTVWALWGFLAALALAWALNYGITLLSRRPR
ncbi:hypothetical protein FGK63_09815 [Ruegeria sediminis]|uniref:Histidinol phosphate aminotransferase n=1 Tax=Ruegeria sediminis TaxID=2583820 RepID=A0ABY2WY06_9RHOB|nr:hypothetical protein [Ruegeria sediminis]TMV07752.1 hypothetical protein FGK63_09815 [Ruegeria sediminis]